VIDPDVVSCSGSIWRRCWTGSPRWRRNFDPGRSSHAVADDLDAGRMSCWPQKSTCPWSSAPHSPTTAPVGRSPRRRARRAGDVVDHRGQQRRGEGRGMVVTIRGVARQRQSSSSSQSWRRPPNRSAGPLAAGQRWRSSGAPPAPIAPPPPVALARARDAAAAVTGCAHRAAAPVRPETPPLRRPARRAGAPPAPVVVTDRRRP
jgi:hypothetical protein